MSGFFKLLKLSLLNNLDKGIGATKDKNKFIEHFALQLDVEDNNTLTYKRNTVAVGYPNFSKPYDHISHGSLLAVYLEIKR